MQEEIWKDIAGYEGIYQVSTLGFVRSLTRKITYNMKGTNKKRTTLRQGGIVRFYAKVNGLKSVILSKGGVCNILYVHEIVARTFINNVGGFPFVEHRNGDLGDNRVDNLFWGSNDERFAVKTPDIERDTEVWRDVIGYEDLYEVSVSGLVRSKKKILHYIHNMTKLPCCKTIGGKILKSSKDNNGYLQVSLKNEKGLKRVSIHRLVAEAFVPNPENKPYIDHINTIKIDNRVENLRWVDAAENNNNLITIQHRHRGKGRDSDKRSIYNLRKKDVYRNGIDLRNVENTAKLSFRKKDGAFLEISVKDGEKVCDFWFSMEGLAKLRDEINEYIDSTKRTAL